MILTALLFGSEFYRFFRWQTASVLYACAPRGLILYMFEPALNQHAFRQRNLILKYLAKLTYNVTIIPNL